MSARGLKLKLINIDHEVGRLLFNNKKQRPGPNYDFSVNPGSDSRRLHYCGLLKRIQIVGIIPSHTMSGQYTLARPYGMDALRNEFLSAYSETMMPSFDSGPGHYEDYYLNPLQSPESQVAARVSTFTVSQGKKRIRECKTSRIPAPAGAESLDYTMPRMEQIEVNFYLPRKFLPRPVPGLILSRSPLLYNRSNYSLPHTSGQGQTPVDVVVGKKPDGGLPPLPGPPVIQ
ncbi:hypothetical protein B0H11DRAFT_1922908 [Mycena galericulata]|nr:hypothetical protein B0H11DRAFT_1922908 [Mycena galericulata]